MFWLRFDENVNVTGEFDLNEETLLFINSEAAISWFWERGGRNVYAQYYLLD